LPTKPPTGLGPPWPVTFRMTSCLVRVSYVPTRKKLLVSEARGQAGIRLQASDKDRMYMSDDCIPCVLTPQYQLHNGVCRNIANCGSERSPGLGEAPASEEGVMDIIILFREVSTPRRPNFSHPVKVLPNRPAVSRNTVCHDHHGRTGNGAIGAGDPKCCFSLRVEFTVDMRWRFLLDLGPHTLAISLPRDKRILEALSDTAWFALNTEDGSRVTHPGTSRSPCPNLDSLHNHKDQSGDSPSSVHNDFGLGDRQIKFVARHPGIDPNHYQIKANPGHDWSPRRDYCSYVIGITNEEDVVGHLEAKQTI
ncbi:hypothetical protein J6590_101617, partial [Homalodisca vitripennis]